MLSGQEPGIRPRESLSAGAVCAELERILASPVFVNSERLSRFLKFVVGEALAGRGEQIKEYVVGAEVFDRGAGFDPRTDPVVRSEARRLRAKLREYYDTAGGSDPLGIDLPKGSYCPVFQRRDKVEPAAQPVPSKKRWILTAFGAAALLAAVVVAYFVARRSPVTMAPGQVSIAVLPLEDLSPDGEHEYFADGMTEAVTTELAKLGNLRVISTTSAMQYKGKKGPLPAIAAALTVNYIVEGSVTRVGNRVRVRAQLIEATADQHRWADDFDTDLSDVLRLQSDVARAIAREVNVRLAQPEPRQPAAARAVNSDAYLAYLRGRYHWYKRTPDGIRKSLEFFNQAVERDPAYAQAYAGLADAYNLHASYSLAAPREVYPKGRAAAERALQIDDTLPEAHTALAAILADYYWEWEQVEKHFRRAIALNPNYALAHMWYSGFLAYNRKRHAEALAEAELARGLDPLSLIAHNNVGFVRYHSRQFDAAIEQFRKVQEMNSSFPPAYLHLGLALLQKRQYSEAIVATDKAVSLSGGDPAITGVLVYTLAAAGQPARARTRVRELEARRNRGDTVGMALAIAYTGLGERDLAFRWFDQACEERSWLVATLPSDPLFDPLRSDPRFANLLRRLNLAP